MDKILLLDWDGPVSNSRTWRMPGCVDPVAIQMLNDAMKAGWRTVLTSTIRKNFDTLGQATEFMNRVGFNVQWYENSEEEFPNWRTSPHFTAHRHLEVLQWMSDSDIPSESIFLVVDDEDFPADVLSLGNMVQIQATPHTGLDHMNISKAYRIFEMDSAQLSAHFNLKG